MRIGAHQLRNALFVAPMAGITDRPFRRLARRYGAALAISEMLSSRPELRESRKTRLRADHAGEPGPISVQIAESAGVQLLTIHGRTRACMFEGCAEYETIAEVKSRLRIPVIANGDVRTPEDAKRVLELTGADGIMVGRAAQGRPWLFREISHYLETGERLAPPPATEMGAILIEHLEGLYTLYGSEQGARVARKHIGWTVRELPGGEALRCAVNKIDAAAAQCAAVNDYFERLAA